MASKRMRHGMSDDSPGGAGGGRGGGPGEGSAPGTGRPRALAPVLAAIVVPASVGFIAGSLESLVIASHRSFFFHSAADAAVFLLIPSAVYALMGALAGACAAVVVRWLRARRGRGAPRSRRAAWSAAASVVVAACVFLCAWSATDTDAPSQIAPPPEVPGGLNVLLITIDTLRADALGCYTHGVPGESDSPVVDALASEGLVFENAIVPMIATGPSHASILTSLYPAEHGIVRNAYRLDDDVPTLAEAFRAIGYRTCGAVSVEHLDGYMSGLSRGFTTYIDRGIHDRFRHHLVWRALPIRWIIEHERDAHSTTDALASWLRGGGPFFAWVHYFDPHMPYVSHEGSGESFGWDDRDRIPEASGEELAGLLARGVSGYGSEVRHVDEAIGRLVTELRRLDLLGETLVVITSDHGEHMHEERLPVAQWFGHYAIFEEACRVPLIVWKPGVVAPGRVAEQVSVMDIGPTVLELAGSPETTIGEGVSLADVRRVPGPPTGGRVERPLVILPNPHGEAEERGLRLGSWKLFQREGGEPILIDLKENPHELLTEPHVNTVHCNYMADLLARIVHDWGEAPRTQEIDEATEEALRALGYVR